MAKNNIHKGHRQRMKQRFLNYPPEFMYDHELLEMALFSTRPLVNTNDTAHALLDSFGSVSRVFATDLTDLEQVSGIGRSSAEFIKVLSEGVRRYLAHSAANTSLASPDSINAYLSGYFSGADTDLCSLITVCPSLELVSTVSLPYSDVAEGKISNRELAEILIMHSTYRLILAIFRPSGSSLPSFADFTLTSKIAELCVPLGIDFINSYVCTPNGVFSMKSHGAFGFVR